MYKERVPALGHSQVVQRREELSCKAIYGNVRLSECEAGTGAVDLNKPPSSGTADSIMDVFRLPTRKLGLVIVLAALMFASMFLNMDTYRSSSSVPMSESPSCPPITTITKEIIKAAPPPKKVVAEDFSSEYRQRLNSIRPIDRLPHSKTLGVASRIYVIGLPGRKDRRSVMAKLEKAMGRSLHLSPFLYYRSIFCALFARY